jgi:hypothetical protein
MSPANASALAGTGHHVNLRTDGGTAYGVNVYPAPGVGAQVIALDASAVVYADGGLDLDVSEYAALELDTAPAARRRRS